jgi:hypothetical protein
VAGAAVASGVEVTTGLDVTCGLDVTDGVDVSAGVVEALEEAPAVTVVTAGVGEGIDGVDDDEQAEIAAEVRMIMAPQPLTVSIVLSPAPAMVVRSLMDPPHASRQMVALCFPRSKHQYPHGQGIRAPGRPLPAPAKDRSRKSAGGREGKTHRRRGYAMT